MGQASKVANGRFGLTNAHIEAIQQAFTRFPEIEQAVLYGSRAKGNYRPSSDIDLVLVLNGAVSGRFRFRVADALDQLNLIYQIDLALLNDIDNEGLLEHIDRVGVPFYVR